MELLKTVLLLALPASGKSEVRRYLKTLSEARLASDFHLGPSIQLDDFPYVHMMRQIDQALVETGHPPVFFEALDRSFRDPRDWGTLIELLNEDYADLIQGCSLNDAEDPTLQFFDRLDRASKRVGVDARIAALDDRIRGVLQRALWVDAVAWRREKRDRPGLEGRTLIIEFARGGGEQASLPLAGPRGYRHSIGLLSPEILRDACVLYVWVTPESSKRKNRERTDPNDPGSILHHGVPEAVMAQEYGLDDMDWLVGQSRRAGTIPIDAHGQAFDLPIGRFDNRQDKTSFIRGNPEGWDPAAVDALHQGLVGAFRQCLPKEGHR